MIYTAKCFTHAEVPVTSSSHASQRHRAAGSGLGAKSGLTLGGLNVIGHSSVLIYTLVRKHRARGVLPWALRGCTGQNTSTGQQESLIYSESQGRGGLEQCFHPKTWGEEFRVIFPLVLHGSGEAICWWCGTGSHRKRESLWKTSDRADFPWFSTRGPKFSPELSEPMTAAQRHIPSEAVSCLSADKLR